MGIIVWILFGLVVGALARLLLPGADPIGWIGTIVVGIVGSFIGGLLGSLFSGASVTALQPSGFIGSLIGAILLLLLARKMR